MAEIEYKRKPKRVTAKKIVKIEEEVTERGTICHLCLCDGSKIRCHRKKDCNCPNIGDYSVTFFKGESPFHMSKSVFEDAFMKTSLIDKAFSYIQRMVKRG